MLSMNQILAITQAEEPIPPSLSEIYSPEFHDIIRWNWSDIRSSLILPYGNLQCNEFSFRFSKLKPQNGVDWWPEKALHHYVICQYAAGIVYHYYSQRRRSVFINFGVSLCCYETNGESNYLYSSRGNHVCLPTAFLIHDGPSFEHFFNDILPSYSLKNYVENVIQAISHKYDGIALPLTIHFFLTENLARIYGGITNQHFRNKKRTNHGQFASQTTPLKTCASRITRLTFERAKTTKKGLTSKCCINGRKNECIFEALSASFDVKRGRPKKTELLIKKKNQKRARRLKKAFVKWVRERIGNGGEEPLSRHGFNSISLDLLENWLHCNINVFSQRCHPAKRICMSTCSVSNHTIGGQQRIARTFNTERSSDGKFVDTVNLLSETNHVYGIVNLKQYSAKYVCKRCNYSFANKQNFEAHNMKVAKCNDGILKYKGNSLVRCANVLKTDFETILPDCELKTDTLFMIVVVSKTMDQRLTLDTIIKYSEKRQLRKKFEFSDLAECCTFLHQYCYIAAEPILSRRLNRNVRNLAYLQNGIEEASKEEIGVKFQNDERRLKLKKLLHVKDALLLFLQHVNCVITAEATHIPLAEKVLMGVLSVMTTISKSSDISIRYAKSKLSSVTTSGQRVRYTCLPMIFPNFTKAETSNSEDFLERTWEALNDTVKSLDKDFGIQMLESGSVTNLGSKIVSSMLSPKQKLSMYSASRPLMRELERTVKYGLLHGKKEIVHADSKYKSIISLDFRRFYTNVLGSSPALLGTALTYTKGSDETFSCPPSRNRNTFANILFSTLQRITGLPIHFSLYGMEIRSEHCVDAVMYMNHQLYSLEYDSCIYHCHFVDSSEPHYLCHQALTSLSDEHLRTCLVCVNAKKTRGHMVPSLFRLSSAQTFQSKHPIRKDKTFSQLKQEADCTRRKKYASGVFERNIEIRDCDILRTLYSPVSEFCKELKLAPLPQYTHETLYDCLHSTSKDMYPLLGKRTLGQKEVIQCIKDGSLRGYVNVSCNLGPVSRSRLGILKPFLFRRSHEGKMEALFSIQRETVSTNLMSFLLTSPELPDVFITEISHFYEYPTLTDSGHDAIFRSTRNKIMDILESKDASEQYCSVLKASLNAYVGNLAVNATRFPKSIILSGKERLAVDQLRNLIKSESLNDSYSIMHFMASPKICNLVHWNVSVISSGIATMLRLALKLNKLTNLTVIRGNCDGYELVASKKIDNDLLQAFQPIDLKLFLKDSLSLSELSEFIDLLMYYFSKPGVCHNHVETLKQSIFDGSTFTQETCCMNYINKNVSIFELKIEFVGDLGLLKSTNRLCFLNTVTGAKLLKCSGHFDNTFLSLDKHSSLLDVLQMAKE